MTDINYLYRSATFIKKSPTCLLSVGCLGFMGLIALLLVIHWFVVIPYRLEASNRVMKSVFLRIQCNTSMDEVVDLFESHKRNGFWWKKECRGDGFQKLELSAPIVDVTEYTWVLHVVTKNNRVVSARIRELANWSGPPPDMLVDLTCQEGLSEFVHEQIE